VPIELMETAKGNGKNRDCWVLLGGKMALPFVGKKLGKDRGANGIRKKKERRILRAETVLQRKNK